MRNQELFCCECQSDDVYHSSGEISCHACGHTNTVSFGDDQDLEALVQDLSFDLNPVQDF